VDKIMVVGMNDVREVRRISLEDGWVG